MTLRDCTCGISTRALFSIASSAINKRLSDCTLRLAVPTRTLLPSGARVSRPYRLRRLQFIFAGGVSLCFECLRVGVIVRACVCVSLQSCRLVDGTVTTLFDGIYFSSSPSAVDLSAMDVCVCRKGWCDLFLPKSCFLVQITIPLTLECAMVLVSKTLVSAMHNTSFSGVHETGSLANSGNSCVHK